MLDPASNLGLSGISLVSDARLRPSHDPNKSTCDFDTPSSCPKDLDFVGWHGMCFGGIQSVEIMRQMRILALAASANAFGPGSFNISGYLVSVG